MDIMLVSVSNLERLHEKRFLTAPGKARDPRQSDHRLLGRHSARELSGRSIAAVPVGDDLQGDDRDPQPAPG